jgi:hypothetical protein
VRLTDDDAARLLAAAKELVRHLGKRGGAGDSMQLDDDAEVTSNEDVSEDGSAAGGALEDAKREAAVFRDAMEKDCQSRAVRMEEGR